MTQQAQQGDKVIGHGGKNEDYNAKVYFTMQYSLEDECKRWRSQRARPKRRPDASTVRQLRSSTLDYLQSALLIANSP